MQVLRHNHDEAEDDNDYMWRVLVVKEIVALILLLPRRLSVDSVCLSSFITLLLNLLAFINLLLLLIAFSLLHLLLLLHVIILLLLLVTERSVIASFCQTQTARLDVASAPGQLL